jgi:hypothetical protein
MNYEHKPIDNLSKISKIVVQTKATREDLKKIKLKTILIAKPVAMKLSKVLLIIAVAVLPFGNLFAQKPNYNYVINNNDDTVKCEIKNALMGKVKYKPLTATDDTYIKITLADIKEYYIAKDSSTYVAIVLPGSTKVGYLRQIEKGKISLYEKITSYYDGFSHTTNTNTYWYISKDFASLRELKSTTIYNDGSQKKRKEFFMDLIADDAPLLEEFKAEDKFGFDRLKYYVHKYNDDLLNVGKVKSK